ncbi:hypothetical protein NLI96_g11280 [Meripilus lineatus]|uniref:Uncharacterized protein n=1 Tax=Meripilus lineatus TaxID=2056292 RepID=A0AAD5US19_9APHY|nr:hypothetical protein NLI96_g11280 [Physisporinus lineatus]
MSKLPLELKNEGDEAFKSGKTQLAIELYTHALAGRTTDDDNRLTTEEVYSLLANRSEAYFRRKLYRNAFRDCTMALSPPYQYMSQGSPTAKAMTARFQIKKAMCLSELTRPTQAVKEYDIFKQSWLLQGEKVPAEDEAKIANIRELSSFLQSKNFREEDGAVGEDEDSDADTENSAEEMDSNTISFLSVTPSFGTLTGPTRILVSAPYINNPVKTGLIPFKGCIEVADGHRINLHLDNVFESAGLEHPGSDAIVKEYMFRALEHQDHNTTKLFLVTRLKRVLEIPWETRLGDMRRGSQWPREGPSPFKDCCKKPHKAKPGESDGPTLENGAIVLYVIPNRYAAAWMKSIKSK